MSAREWSPYQRAVFDAVANGEGHIVVEALAGSGKTSTIVEALNHTCDEDSVLMAAFNKSIADELRSRVPQGVDVCTWHSFGNRVVCMAMGRRDVDYYVAAKAKEILGGDWASREARTAVVKLVSLAKGCLRETPEDLDELADSYGVDFPEKWDRQRLIATACRILRFCRERERGPIDYDDMIWLPIARDMGIPTFDFVFVDETQDLNAAQLELAIRAAGDTGRIIAVGDRRQAIYGFRGAAADAIPRMIRRLGARVLPLSITYRCPAAVVAEARALVPAIEPAPGAPAGVVRYASTTALERDAQPGDFVVSRTNAPLVSLCYRWLREGRRAEIKGRDVGAGLASWIRGTNASTVPELMRCIAGWRDAEIERLTAADRDTASVIDRAECLSALTEGCDSVNAVISKIERMFGDGARGGILLSSTHRAKGLEADRVWLLRDTYKRWPGPEEDNLLYVAITRARRELVYVTESAAESAEAAE